MYFGGKYILYCRAMGFREQGMTAAAAGDHEKAATLLVRYLRRQPKDIEALSAYVLHREQAELPNFAHLADTIAGLKMLLQADPTRIDDRRHLLELYQRFNMRTEALDAATAILDRMPNDRRTLEIKTELLARSNQHKEALAVADQWIAAAPIDIQAHMARIVLRGRLNHTPEQILGDVSKLCDQHPDDPRFELLTGFAYAQLGNGEQAAQWLRKAAKRASPDDAFTKILINQLDAMGMSEESLTLLQDLSRSGAGREVRHSLAKRLWEVGRWDQVAELLKDLNPANPQTDSTLLAFHAMALSQLKKAEQSAACRQALARRDHPVARAWSLLLDQLLVADQLGNPGGTSPLQPPAGSANVTNAGGTPAIASTPASRQVVSACKSALGRDPYNIYLRYYLGDAQLRLREVDLAIEAWRQVAGENLTWVTPVVRLAELLLERGQFQPALEAAAVAARRDPTSAAAVVALAQAWAANVETGRVGQTEQLLQMVSQIQKELPGEQRTLAIQIQLLARSGKKPQAIELARAAVGANPAPDEQSLINLSALSHSLDLGLEEACFTRSQELYSATAPLAYARAVHEYASGRAGDGLRLFDQSAKNATGDDRLWQAGRGQYLDLIGDAAAQGALIALADAHPKDLAIQQAVLASRSVRGDFAFLQKTLDRIKALSGEESLAWQLAQARLYLESGKGDAERDKAAVMLSGVVQLFPDVAEPRVLLARALISMGRPEGAIEHLSVAARLDPSNVPVALQLASLLQSHGDFDRARQHLDRIAPQLRDGDQKRHAALLLAQQGRPEAAIRLLEQQTDRAGGQSSDLLLAMLYRQRRDPAKAEAIVKRLLDTDDLGAIEFAVSLYASQGRQDEAKAALDRLDRLKLQPGVKLLARASYHAQIGELTQAIALFEQATRESPGTAVAWRNGVSRLLPAVSIARRNPPGCHCWLVQQCAAG